MAISSAEVQDQNRSEVPTQTVTNTPYGNLIGKCCSTNQKINLPQYTTLNEVYNIMGEESIGVKNGRDFELKFFGIGIRGSACDGKDARGVTKLKVNQHQPIDGNLFTAVPFILRPIDNDLDNVNRAKYRLRTVETLSDGVTYAVYWLKLIDFANYNPSVNKITRDAAGNETAKPYVPSKDNLFNPQPVDFTSENTVPISDTYMNSSAILDCSMSAQDLVELANACKVYFGDSSYASINEVGVAWGIDTQFDGQIAGGATIRYTEVLSAVFSHYITERDGRNAINNTKIQLAFDHGASEPMLLHTTATASTSSQGN
jgi:hypothetical protein